MKRRIVVDFDGTLALGVSPNIMELEPNIPLIESLKIWNSAGYEIIVETARGQLSCNGDVNEASIKYYHKIAELLRFWGVPYSSLSFRKYLADIYIDDRSIKPEDFITTDKPVVLSGLSGDTVIRVGDKVIKSHSNQNAYDIFNWYNVAKEHGFNVPEINSVVGNTIEMEYIEKFNEVTVDSLMGLVKKFSLIKTDNNPLFYTYIDRVKSHISKNGIEAGNILKTLDSYSRLMDMNGSFNHGDLNPDNVIDGGGVEFLIDPIYNDDLFKSWLIDLTKVIFWYQTHGMQHEAERAWKWFHNVPNKLLMSLVGSHLIRVYSYLKDSSKKQDFEIRIRAINEYLG